MRRWLIVGLGLFAAVLVGVAGYTRVIAPPPTPTPEPVDEGPEVIWATGKILPARRATLSFTSAGTLSGVMVREGDEVARGDLLALLDDGPLLTALDQAEAALLLAQAKRDQTVGGAAAADIDAARETTRAAEAEVQTAEARLRGAAADVDRARAELQRALAVQGDVLQGPTADEARLAEIELDMARDRLYGAQSRRDTIGGALDRDEALQADYDVAKAAVLEAEDAVRAAEVRVRQLLAGASVSERTTASSAAAGAQAALRASQAQVDALVAQRDAARARADEAAGRAQALADGPEAAALRVSELEVVQAQVAVQAARQAAESARLLAPFEGTVGAVMVLPGEVVTPGQPVVTLGDLTHLRVETTDLRETDVTKVSKGQEVYVTFDSLPELRLSGIVDLVAPMASPGQGGTSYTVWVELGEADDRLRWGMTAYANIVVGMPVATSTPAGG